MLSKIWGKGNLIGFVAIHSTTGLFNYILKLMHTGCQWENIPIDKDVNGKPEIHYTNIYNAFKFWVKRGCFDEIFEASVSRLFAGKMLDISVLHGDGTCTAAKKGAII